MTARGLDDVSDVYVPIRDDLPTGPRERKERHLNARVAFLQELVSDPRVEPLFEAVDDHIGLLAAARAFAATADEYAREAGYPDRGALFSTDEACEERTDGSGGLSPEESALVSSLEQVSVLLAQTSSEAQTIVRNFVRDELKLPWVWLTLELLTHYRMVAQALILGRSITRTISLRDQAAPQVSFDAKAGETVSQWLVRLAEWHREVIEPLLEPPEKKATQRQGLVESWARWFYRCRVMHPPDSIRGLAKEQGCSRSTIDHALEEVEKLLGDTSHIYG